MLNGHHGKKILIDAEHKSLMISTTRIIHGERAGVLSGMLRFHGHQLSMLIGVVLPHARRAKPLSAISRSSLTIDLPDVPSGINNEGPLSSL